MGKKQRVANRETRRRLSDGTEAIVVDDLTPEPEQRPRGLAAILEAVQDPIPPLEAQITLGYLYRIHDKNRELVHERIGFTEEDCPRCNSFQARLETMTSRIREAFDDGRLDDLRERLGADDAEA